MIFDPCAYIAKRIMSRDVSTKGTHAHTDTQTDKQTEEHTNSGVEQPATSRLNIYAKNYETHQHYHHSHVAHAATLAAILHTFLPYNGKIARPAHGEEFTRWLSDTQPPPSFTTRRPHTSPTVPAHLYMHFMENDRISHFHSPPPRLQATRAHCRRAASRERSRPNLNLKKKKRIWEVCQTAGKEV